VDYDAREPGREFRVAGELIEVLIGPHVGVPHHILGLAVIVEDATLFPVPNFPSYPSNHSTFSAARSEVLAYLFPEHADFVRALAQEAGQSRIWDGIHFPMDNVAGLQLGKWFRSFSSSGGRATVLSRAPLAHDRGSESGCVKKTCSATGRPPIRCS